MVSTSIFGRKTSYARCVIVFLYLFLLPHKTYSQPCSSSCGKISNINHPFRLKHDPDHCGNNLYELNCVNNVTVLKLFDAEYFVQSINYNNYTIRVVDPNIQPNNCSSLPRFFLYRTNFTYYTNSYEYSLLRSSSYDGIDLSSTSYVFDGIDLSRPVIYMNCTSPPSNNVNMYYTDTSSCMGQHNIYAIVGDPQLGILEPQCRVKLVTLTSFWVPPPVFSINNIIGNVSYIDIHKALGYGFEISWILAFCPCDHCYLKDPAGDILCYDPKPNCTNCFDMLTDGRDHTLHIYTTDILHIRDVLHGNGNTRLAHVLREQNSYVDFTTKEGSHARCSTRWNCPPSGIESLVLRDKLET
ncbi:hypothetical protein MTR_1g028090 [Medicago truncatula]|uniref:Wall-associated receptor kinase galacturonan-binding domain-containing protein n=1 Tax=Medicago truncatula TaxID=3880 RepID=A0A072VQJ5_MEDTR|nr:hypothetical protein MTR_1g028090 [Medicago truncatula]